MQEAIYQIGERITHCPHKCSGVRNEPERGIVPRGLIYEDRSGNGNGIVIVGLNPGVAKPHENDYRQEHGMTYQVVVDCWKNLSINDFPYFKKPRHLIEELGLFGDILWTNIAKCECNDSKVRISFSTEPQTFRFCANQYLKNELKLVPSWPIVACGKDAFTALSYINTDRKIIGIPHPTGAGIEFRKLYEDGNVRGKLKGSVKKQYEEFYNFQPTGALWLRGNK